MDRSKLIKQLKMQWIRDNIVLILVLTTLIIGLFIFATIFHKFLLIIVGILIGFTLIFYGRNKMMTYVERNS